MQRKYVALVLFVLTVNLPADAGAVNGDIYRKGTDYCAITYSGHSVYSKVGGTPVDLNVGGGDDDNGEPLYAPKDGGNVTIVTRDGHNDDGWGNSITWADRNETLYLAHLSNFGAVGRVDAGDVIGYVGKTGNSDTAHLHIQSSNGNLILSGNVIDPPLFPKSCRTYTSKGQTKEFFCVSEPATHPFEKEYDIAWWPSDVPCVEAREWMENERCVYNVYALSYDKTICKKAFSTLSRRSWIWDGTYDGWYKIFFEKFDLSYLQCK